MSWQNTENSTVMYSENIEKEREREEWQDKIDSYRQEKEAIEAKRDELDSEEDYYDDLIAEAEEYLSAI
ncbi:hypothetical protein [Fructobacillus fructosus]|uniref:hypothetical protein n=1 Tax=Fructobacillus fructosus TaxID=1631 RepID=UPI002D85179A|nr:unnamed protein product [Fructobacillus fructosus]CAK1251068.1 unnamed protein product [Fructobacillus fructosus]CAK1252611.1 unnamed protein product [Fructobacillus fructosus]